MGTQGTGRRRSTNKERTTAEDDALNLIAREAEARLAAKRAARAEAREIRMKELERQQKELSDDDERMSVGSRGSVRVEDGNYLEKGSRAASALTATTLTSLGGTSSRRGSGETALTLDAETSIREIKDKLSEVEEKYRKAMVSNAQLDNEKNNLMYQVDTLKDSLMELEELLSESRREHEDKLKELEREKHAHTVLQFQFSELKETLKQSEELLNEIRQLRLKEEGFHREISDLQETVEWKDKKISALERQKEYTDAIRVERDELREEVVTLKDILKKHGIVLGPDLNINGEVTETVNSEESPSADPASQPQTAQESPISPTDGNSSMLGNTEEEAKETRNDQKKEIKPTQSQEMHDQNEEKHSDDNSKETDASKVDICGNEEQPKPKSEDLNEISEAISTEDQLDTAASFEETVVVAEIVEQKFTDYQELGATQDIESNAIQPTSKDHVEEQVGRVDEVDSPTEVTEICPEQSDNAITEESLAKEQSDNAVTEEAPAKDGTNDETIAAACKTEPHQDLVTVDGDSEDLSAKPQATSASGKKKKRKKRSKKKGGNSEEKKEQSIGAEKANTKKETGSDVATKDGGPLIQANNELSTDSHSQNITDNGQVNKEINLVEASKDDTEQTGEQDKSIIGIGKDEEISSLTDKEEKIEPVLKVTIAEAHTTCSEIDEAVVTSPGVKAAPSNDISESTGNTESLENTATLDNGGQDVGSEIDAGNDASVATMEKTKSSKKGVIIKYIDRDVTDALQSLVVVAKPENIIEEVEKKENGQEEKSELNVQDNDLKGGLEDSEKPKLDGKHDICENEGLDIDSVAQDEILNKVESPKLQNMGQNEESAAEVPITEAATEEAESEVANEMNLVAEDRNVENMATTDGKGQEKSGNEQESEASSAVEVPNKGSSEDKELEVALGSEELKSLEEGVEIGAEVLLEEDASKELSNNDEPQVQTQNVENVSKEFDIVDKGTENVVQVDSESVPEELSEHRVEDKEVAVALLACGEEKVEVSVEDDNAKEQSSNSEPHEQTQNVDKELDVVETKTESAVQNACQEVELPGHSMKDEVKPLVEVGAEVLVEEDTSKDQPLDSKPQELSQNLENGNKELDVDVSESQSAVELQGVGIEIEEKPLEEKTEVGVEVSVEEDHNDQPTESKPHMQTHSDGINSTELGIVDIGSQNAGELPQVGIETEAKPLEEEKVVVGVTVEEVKSISQSINSEPPTQNDNKELEEPDIVSQSVAPQTDSEGGGCHIVEVSGDSVEVKAEQSVPLEQDDEEDEGEGLLFDFDDVDMEAAIALSGETKSLEDEVEVAVEVLADDGDSKEEMVESEQQVQSQNVEKGSKELAIVEKEADITVQNKDNDSLDGASIANKPEEQTSQDQPGATVEQRPAPAEPIQNSSENNNKQSCPVEVGVDATKLPQSKHVVGAKGGSKEAGAHSEAARSGKDAKKGSSNKKGKGKNKEDCKVN